MRRLEDLLPGVLGELRRRRDEDLTNERTLKENDMLSLTIKLDVDQWGFDNLTGVPQDDIIHLAGSDPLEVGTLRQGTASGKDSVALCFLLPDGRPVIAETSAQLFLAAAQAISAWQQGRRERGDS